MNYHLASSNRKRLTLTAFVAIGSICASIAVAQQNDAGAPKPPVDQWEAVISALDRNVDAAIEAKEALQPIPADSDPIAILVERLEATWLTDRSLKWSLNCVSLLEQLTGEETTARRLLIRILEDDRVAVRQAALEAAIRTQAVEESRILPLIARLHQGNSSERFEAATMLRKFGTRAAPASESLIRAATNETQHATIRWAAVFALRDMGPVGVKALGKVIAMSEKSVAYKALDSLAALGEKAAPAYASVATALRNEDPRIRARAATVMGLMHGEAREALPLLRGLLEDPDQHVRDAAAEAIRRLSTDPSRRNSFARQFPN